VKERKVDFQILGPLEVCERETRIEVLGSRRRSLLTLLIVHAGTPVSAGQLIEDLWGGRPPNAAVATLQSHVSALRRLLPVPLLFRYGGYMLDANADCIDARLFEAEVRAAQLQFSKGEIGQAADILTNTLARWRGPALADALGATWAVVEVARLEELHGMAFETLLELRLILEQPDEAAVLGELAVATYPLRERLWANLMLALYRSGRQAEALRAYRRLHQHLSEELGISPSPLLTRLEGAILLQDAGLAAVPESQAALCVPRFGIHRADNRPCVWGSRTSRHAGLNGLPDIAGGPCHSSQRKTKNKE
jgi:DNA-binding SARP family transcriptional activator